MSLMKLCSRLNHLSTQAIVSRNSIMLNNQIICITLWCCTAKERNILPSFYPYCTLSVCVKYIHRLFYRLNMLTKTMTLYTIIIRVKFRSQSKIKWLMSESYKDSPDSSLINYEEAIIVDVTYIERYSNLTSYYTYIIGSLCCSN